MEINDEDMTLPDTEVPNRELLHLLEMCGHFLYHRRNGRGGQRRILILLKQWEEEHGMGAGMTQQMLQERLGIASGSVSEILGKMEGKNLIRKERQESDRRKICIYLTQEGRDHLARKEEEIRQQELVLFKCLSKEEQQELERLMEKLLEGWRSEFGFGMAKENSKTE